MISANKIFNDRELKKLLKILKMEKEQALGRELPRREGLSSSQLRIIRDFFLFTFISFTGLRISEAIHLLPVDIFDDYLIVRPELSKNGKTGTVYFGKKTRALIEELKKIKSNMNVPIGGPLFSFSGRPNSRSYLHSRFKFWLKLCDLPSHHSIHSLRHTYATQCLDKGLSLTFVRDNLRHSNISVTSQYLHLTQKNRDKIKDLF